MPAWPWRPHNRPRLKQPPARKVPRKVGRKIPRKVLQRPHPQRRRPMPDEPTYREEQMGDRTVYTCIVPDAGAPDGICGHKTIDEGFMTQHQQQRHRGEMVLEAPTESGDTAVAQDEALSPSADTAATPPEAQPPTAPQETPEEPV